MKYKRAIQVLTVCFSVVLLGAYVVYAHRQAQPSVAPTTEPSLEGSVQTSQATQPGGDNDLSESNPASKTEQLAARASTVDGPTFRSSSLPSPPQEATAAPSDSGVSSSLNSTGFGTVNFRVDGSSVTTRVQQERAPVFAPSSKVIILPVFSTRSPQTSETAPAKPVQINGQILKPGTFRNSESPKLIGVISPPTAPPANLPSAQQQTVSPAIATTTAVPRETIIFSTKSAPVFVAPREAPAPTPAAPTTGTPTAQTAGSITQGTPAAIPPPQPPRADPPNSQTLKQSDAPPQNPPAQTAKAPTSPTQPGQVEAPKPRFLAPGSKSIDLLLLEKTAAPKPTQFPVPSAPEKPKP